MESPPQNLNAVKVELEETEDTSYIFNVSGTINVIKEEVPAIQLTGGLMQVLNMCWRSYKLCRNS